MGPRRDLQAAEVYDLFDSAAIRQLRLQLGPGLESCFRTIQYIQSTDFITKMPHGSDTNNTRELL